MSYADEDYFIPPENQQVFGAGIRRKRVPFVRSSEHELNTTSTATATNVDSQPSATAGGSIANKYLSIVLPKSQDKHQEQVREHQIPSEPGGAPPPPSSSDSTPQLPRRCEVCSLPLTASSSHNPDRPHEASLAHQLCLAHSHPPSHLDRTRHGLRYLSAYGWDPDSRLGVGAPGREGIREPVKPKVKHDTVGLGLHVDQDVDEMSSSSIKRNKNRIKQESNKPAKVEKLNAKQVQEGHADAKKKGEKLREMIYQDDKLQKYLGHAS